MKCRWSVAPLLLVAAIPACYTYQPLAGTTPLVGSEVVADLTDRGVADMGGTLGPGVGRIEGRVLRAGPDTLQVAVARVDLVRGGTTQWAGEAIAVPTVYVSRLRQKQFSRSRTAVVTAAIVAGIAAIFLTTSLVIDGREDGGDQQPGGGGQT